MKNSKNWQKVSWGAEPEIWHGGPMPGGTTLPWWHGHPMPCGTTVPSPIFRYQSRLSASFAEEWHGGAVPPWHDVAVQIGTMGPCHLARCGHAD